MDTPFKPQIELKDLSAEVTSYIYQVILEFEPFLTETTKVAVVSKNPMQLLSSDDSEEILIDKKKLAKMYRIAISLTEDGTEISEEGFHEDLYEAIRMAKDKLLKTLVEIQDDVITSQDRSQQIKTALAGGMVH